MSDAQPPKDILSPAFELYELPAMLNVLTILTFVGCGLAYLSAVITFFTIDVSRNMLNDINSNTGIDKLPGWLKSLLNMYAEAVRIQYEHRILFFFSAIVANSLCLWGTILMRNLKLQGFYIYTIGESGYPLFYKMV